MPRGVCQLAGEAFQTMIDQSVVPVMIDFGTPWCLPCVQQAPITRQVARQMGRRARICSVDIDRDRSLAARLNIHSIPTLIIYSAAWERERFFGVQTAEKLVAALTRWVALSDDDSKHHLRLK